MKARARTIGLAEHRRGHGSFDEPLGINASWWLAAIFFSLMLWSAILASAMKLAEVLRLAAG